MSHREEDEWIQPHRKKSQKTQQKGASLLSPESSASSDDTCIDDGSILGGRSSSDVSQPGGQLTKILSETFLQRVADKIHVKDWKPIFRELVGPFVDNVEVLIGDIKKDNQDNCREQRYQALLKWKSTMPGDDEAKYEYLTANLQKQGCWVDISDQQLESVPYAGGARQKQPQQTGTGAKPKVTPKPKYEVDDQGILTIRLEGSTEPLLQVKLKDDMEIDEGVVADALLISIITPSFAIISVQMELTEFEDRFYDKYGNKGLSFESIGVGSIEIYVGLRGRNGCIKLKTKDKKKYIQVNGDKSKLHVFLPPVGGNYDSDNLGKHEKPSEQSLHTTKLCEWHPAKSKRSTKQIQKSTMSESPAPKKLFCQMPDAKQFATLIAKSDNSSVKFRTEGEYSGESGSIAFTKDVVAWWNTPRSGYVYLIVGVKGCSSPPHDLIGLQTRRINADYQAMFDKCFYHTPTFYYSEVEYSDKVFGVVGIPNSKGSGEVCWATETKGDYWTQNNILFFGDGGTIMPATKKNQDNIYKWFHSPPDKVSSRRSPKKAADEAWEEFLLKLDLEKQPRRSYCLLVSQCSNETQNLQALAKFPWLQVWDFDPDSRESGFLAVCEADLQDRLAVKTWNDAPQDSLSETFIEWLFIRGLRKREDSLVLCSVREWILRVGKHLNGYCDLLSTYCEDKPLTVVVVWYGSTVNLRYLKRTLLKLDEHTSGITYIICMQKTPDDEDLMKELCQELEVARIIEIPLERLCFGMLSIVDDKPHADLMRHLPGSALSISNRDSRWFQQELEVLYKNDELLKQENVKPGEVFLRGGTLSWQEVHLGIFDAKRNLWIELNAFLQNRLRGPFSCVVSLFHEPGAGGTTLSRRILWDFHDHFPCVYAFADVIDPSKIFERLESLYCRTNNTSILLIVDGQESRLVQELFEMSQDKIHIVILSVQRYTKAIGKKSHAQDKFWLKGEVDSVEAQRLNAVFSQITKGKTKTNLQKLVREVEEKQKHFVYEFGLTVYNEAYKGLRSYVRGYLALRTNEDLTEWQIAVGYLALAFFYGHKCIPCQFFSLLFGKKDTEIVSACDEVLTHKGKQFVLEDIGKCTWRITHHAVAKELLEQILTQGNPSNGEVNELSIPARRNLREFAKKFLTYASKRLQHSKLDHSSSVMRTLRVIFIHRDYTEIGQDQYRREILSRLMCDIQGTPKEKLDLMKLLVECFPKDPTFVFHLGRACNIYTHEFEKSLELLNRAKELRQSEIKAYAEKYCQSDTTSQSHRAQDAILCTIYHSLGVLCHDQIKSLIGGGNLKDRKHYKGKPNEENLQKICKFAQSAIHNFSTCRQHLEKGMDESYGYIGEIKVHLHIADYVGKCSEQGGYFGFLSSKEISAEARKFVNSCFSKVCVLLTAYQELIKTTEQRKSDELDSCLNWFSVIFSDTDTALQCWQGKDVDSCRDKIAVYKIKHQGRPSACRTTAHVLNNIESAEDVQKIVELYENIFRDAHRKSLSINVSTELSDWIVAIRNNSLQSTTYSMSEIVLPQVRKCHSLTPHSITTLYYLYVVNATLALLTRKEMYIDKSNQFLKQMEEKRSTVNRHHRKFVREWLRTYKERSIHCLVHRSCLGPWDSEKRFWQDGNAHAKLQVCTGVITACEKQFYGRITITTGGSSDVPTSVLSAVYVPKQYGLYGKNYLNREVEFFIGFNIEHGIEAFNVCELKKSRCDHCKITVSMSRLEKPEKKVCHKCGRRIHEISSTQDAKCAIKTSSGK